MTISLPAIGGVSPAQHNVIAFNSGRGVFADISMPGIRNAAKATILGNSIFNNGLLGIDLGGNGVTVLLGTVHLIVDTNRYFQ